MPSGAVRIRTPSAKACSACLEAAYTTLFGDVVLEAPEPKYTTVPVDSFSWGSTQRVSSAGTVIFRCKTSDQTAAVASSKAYRGAIAAVWSEVLHLNITVPAELTRCV